MVKHIVLLAVVALAGCLSLPGQTDSTGVMVLSEGLEFHVAGLPPHLGPGETAPDNSLVLVLTSRAGTVVRIGDPLSINIPVPAGAVRFWRIPRLETSVHVRGDRPFHVSTMQNLRGNGEQAWQLPLYAWDTRYRPFQWWQDSYGVEGSPETTTVARMMILGGPDETAVVVDGNGTIDQYDLDPFGSVVIDEPERQGASRDAASDPTGREIRSTHPIAVISGHSKGGVLRYPIGLPSTGEYARPANRSRGNLHDAMLPVEYAATEFVTVPLRYTPTRIHGWNLEEQGIEDDRGDVIRFIATEDGTEIRSSGPGIADHVDTVLDAGGSWYAARVEQPRRWSATKPVLCAQYGKSFGRIISQADRPDLDPTVDAGMPMLLTVQGVGQWTDEAILYAHDNTDNFLNIACRTADVADLHVDGLPIALPLVQIEIPGTSYTTISGPLPRGAHRITTQRSGVRFAAWTYGSDDGLQLGRIYGSIAGMDLAIACSDTLTISEQTYSDSVVFTYDVATSGDCGAIAMAYAERCDGGIVVRRNNSLVITRATPTTMVDGNILVVTRSGRFERRWFHLDGTTGLNDAVVDAVVIAPHPVHDVLTIRATGSKPLAGTLRLISMTGDVVRSIEVQNRHVVDVPVSDLASGTYALVGGALRQLVVISP